MYRLASFVAFLIVGFVVIGYFRGWLTMETTKPGMDGKVHVNFTVDRDKLRDDVQAAKQAVKSGVDTMKKEFGENGAKATTEANGVFNSNLNQTSTPTSNYDNVRYR